MLPPTATRVQERSPERVNRRIRRQIEGSLATHAEGDAAEIGRSLQRLDEEWDIERSLQTNFACVTAIGIALGALVDKRWYWFSAGAAGFMVQHALQGWCPPMPVLRHLDFRTMSEINRERLGLKNLRGDFEGLPDGSAVQRARAALNAARR